MLKRVASLTLQEAQLKKCLAPSRLSVTAMPSALETTTPERVDHNFWELVSGSPHFFWQLPKVPP